MLDGFGFGINDAGDVSGSLQRGPDDYDLAFTGHEGALHDVPVRPGQPHRRRRASGRAVRQHQRRTLRGRVVGAGRHGPRPWAPRARLAGPARLDPRDERPRDWDGASNTADGTPTAFVSRLEGPLLALPDLNGAYGTESYVHGLDRDGDAAGQTTTTTGELHATVWTCAFAQARPLKEAASLDGRDETPANRPGRSTRDPSTQLDVIRTPERALQVRPRGNSEWHSATTARASHRARPPVV